MSPRDEGLARLAHDMGGALGAIVGYASVLEDELDPGLTDRHRRCLDGITEGAEALSALIDELRARAAARPVQDEQT